VGHWSQYRHRGRGAAATQSIAPPAELDWDVGEDGGQCFITSLNTGPGDQVDRMEAEIYAVGAPDVINETWSTAVNNTALSVNVFDEVRGIRVRWCVGSTPVSG